MDKKRVGCLYRVSTLKQVEEDDIPMQRVSCSNYISQHKDWKLEKEYIELGVSGYKLSESKRDVLQDIKKDVLKKEIDDKEKDDILLLNQEYDVYYVGLKALKSRFRSVKELKDYLLNKEYPEEYVDKAISKLLKQG